MHRFFITPESVSENEILITGEDVKHIINVLRMKKSEEAVLCDGEGNDYYCTLEQFDKSFVKALIKQKQQNNAEPLIDVTLFQGIAKGDKMDFIIQKNVEMGVKTIVPVITSRTIVKLFDKKDIEAKVQRWQRIALEAAKQCGRGIIPIVKTPISLMKAYENSKNFELNIMPYEKEKSTSLREVITGKRPKSIAIYIGPEGGFSEEEASQALLCGLKCVTLGERILRTETCALVLMSILMYEMGDVKV
jgi:16S rRNA (uracil1498-N3)-methyltransferase